CPVSLALVVLVRDRAFHDEDEGTVGCALRRLPERENKIVAILVGKERIVEADFRNPRQCTQHKVLDTGLCRTCHRDGVPIATEAGGQPKNVDLWEGAQSSA